MTGDGEGGPQDDRHGGDRHGHPAAQHAGPEDRVDQVGRVVAAHLDAVPDEHAQAGDHRQGEEVETSSRALVFWTDALGTLPCAVHRSQRAGALRPLFSEAERERRVVQSAGGGPRSRHVETHRSASEQGPRWPQTAESLRATSGRLFTLRLRLHFLYFSQYSGISSLTWASSSSSLMAVMRPSTLVLVVDPAGDLVDLDHADPVVALEAEELVDPEGHAVGAALVGQGHAGRAAQQLRRCRRCCRSARRWRRPPAWMPARVVLKYLPTNG